MDTGVYDENNNCAEEEGEDCAAGEGKEEGRDSENCEKEVFSGGFSEYEIVKREEGGGEEKVAHKLGFEGEAVRVGEAEGLVGAAGAEKEVMVEEDVRETLEPTEGAGEESGELEDFEKLTFITGR